MVFNFFTQGYLFTAFLLFFLYCFYDRYRNYFYNLAKTANRIIGIFLFALILVFLATAQMAIILFGINFTSLIDPVNWVVLLLNPYIIVFIALLVPKIRHYRVWILIPVALLLNIPIISNLVGINVQALWYIEIDSKLPAETNIILFGFAFLLLVIFIEAYTRILKRLVKKADNRLPERV